MTAETLAPDAGQFRTERDAHDKRIANAVARAALAGFQIHIVADGAGGSCFLVSRWNLSRTLPDVAAVEQFLDQVGRRHG